MNRATFIILLTAAVALFFYFSFLEPHRYAAGYFMLACGVIYPLRRWYLVKHQLLTPRFWQIIDYFTKP